MTNVYSEGNYAAAAADLGGILPAIVAACDVLAEKAEKRAAWTPPAKTGPTNSEILKREREASNPLVADYDALMAALKDVRKALGMGESDSTAYPDDDQEGQEITFIRKALAASTITEKNPYGTITVEQARQFAQTVPRYNGREFKIEGEARVVAPKAD